MGTGLGSGLQHRSSRMMMRRGLSRTRHVMTHRSPVCPLCHLTRTEHVMTHRWSPMAFGRGSLSAWDKDKSFISLKSSSSDLDASGSRSIYSSWSPFAKGKTGSVRNVNSSARSMAALGRSPNYVMISSFLKCIIQISCQVR
jgi:hypothetical protein